MKIRIIKCSKPNSWYKNLIGKIYCVKKIHEFIEGKPCYIIRNYRTILRTINFDDAEVLNEGKDKG